MVYKIHEATGLYVHIRNTTWKGQTARIRQREGGAETTQVINQEHKGGELADGWRRRPGKQDYAVAPPIHLKRYSKEPHDQLHQDPHPSHLRGRRPTRM